MYINIIYSVLYEKPSHCCFRMFGFFQKTKNIAYHHVSSVNGQWAYCSCQNNGLTKRGVLYNRTRYIRRKENADLILHILQIIYMISIILNSCHRQVAHLNQGEPHISQLISGLFPVWSNF